MFGCYRRGEAEDPETYLGAVIVLLTSYPETIVFRVTDPRTGLPGRSKFLPTISEIRDFCEKEMVPLRLAIERDNRAAFVRNDRRVDGGIPPERRAILATELRERFKTDEQKLQEAQGIDARKIHDPIRKAAAVRYNEKLISEARAAIKPDSLKLSDAALFALIDAPTP